MQTLMSRSGGKYCAWTDLASRDTGTARHPSLRGTQTGTA